MQDSEVVEQQHCHDERHQDQRHGKEDESDRVHDHLKMTDVVCVRDGGDDLAKLGVLACHPNDCFHFSRFNTAIVDACRPSSS